MYKAITSETPPETREKKSELTQKIWALLVLQNKKYDVFYDIRAYASKQHDSGYSKILHVRGESGLAY